MKRKRATLVAAVVLMALVLVGAAAVLMARPGQAIQTPAPPGGGFGTGAANTLITGTVTCDGKPLPTGAVFFIGPQGLAGQGMVGGDGRYQAGLVPEGPMKVAYTSRPLTERQIQVQLGNPDPGPGWDWIDQAPPPADVLRTALAAEARYGPAKTALRYTVVRGPQTFDVALTSR
ncbi:hypothetical protein GobsT_39560 [Gemmata obscuriglobus]|uniref:Carboxypeptidase regulatory-like domain-containing protein n=1 Tax=Gemmata obscuriglobus TaxID=114 RepID=A0A2Z3H0X2_9BACT|nr:hypothetical protein [Gemmata obscuriglobus]AWM37972.1 hypothetical protein C1280_13880 [Gemmata obscuriglobus]QEG29167.1 hypothetical protein GobsT_39560 [Gemmata obscuriglobus]VTS07909.1 unnamed protein product [Gemmata obscuriglobus UQM 2246]